MSKHWTQQKIIAMETLIRDNCYMSRCNAIVDMFEDLNDDNHENHFG